MTISSEFHEAPFAKRAGQLSPDSGGEDFFEYSTHRKLRDVVEESFARPITYRVVFGAVGEGKTWTLSWLWRESLEHPKTMVIGIPKLDAKKAPERAFMEAVGKVITTRYTGIFEKALRSRKATEEVRTVAAYYQDAEARMALLGQGSSARVPRIEGLRAFSMASLDDLHFLMLGVLESARLANYDRVLIIVDEVESTFAFHSKKAVSIFTDWLRGLYDILESADDKYPSVQLLLAGTSVVHEIFGPENVRRLIDEGNVMGAFVRRTEDVFVIEPPTPKEVMQLASKRIDQHRKKRDKPYIPYEEAAIDAAWKSAGQNIGHFIRILQQMYDAAERDRASKITLAHFKMVTSGA